MHIRKGKIVVCVSRAFVRSKKCSCPTHFPVLLSLYQRLGKSSVFKKNVGHGFSVGFLVGSKSSLNVKTIRTSLIGLFYRRLDPEPGNLQPYQGI